MITKKLNMNFYDYEYAMQLDRVKPIGFRHPGLPLGARNLEYAATAQTDSWTDGTIISGSIFFNIECNYYLLYSYIYMYQCSMCKYVYDCIYLSCQPLIHSCWLGGSLDIRLPFAHNVSPLDMLACPGKCSEVTVRYEIDFFLPGKYARRHCRSWLFLA